VALYRRLAGAAFDDRAVKAMAVAYEAVLLDLKLIDRDDALTEIIANKIIECAATGERDADRLRGVTLQHIRG
jgi:hypothetical protein